MNNGWVTTCDTAYLGVLRVLIEGLRLFSKYPLEVFWYDDEPPPANTPQVTFVSITIRDNKTKGGKWMGKLTGICKTTFDYGAFIDSDLIPNRNVDELIEFSINTPRPYPLFSAHPSGPEPETLNLIASYANADKQTMHYSLAQCVFCPQSKPFFEEARKLAESLPLNLYQADEGIMNSLLWKQGVVEQLNFFVPHFIGLGNHYFSDVDIFEPPCGLSFHFFHGCKDEEHAQSFLERVKRDDRKLDGCRANKPYLIKGYL